MVITSGNAPMTPADGGLRWRLIEPSPARAQGVKTAIPDKNPAAAKGISSVRPTDTLKIRPTGDGIGHWAVDPMSLGEPLTLSPD
jgi:hypothetical protein